MIVGTRILFHRTTKTVRIEMICWSFKHFSKKHANPDRSGLPYQPENNEIPVQTPPSVALDALRTLAVSRIYLDTGRLKSLFARARDRV